MALYKAFLCQPCMSSVPHWDKQQKMLSIILGSFVKIQERPKGADDVISQTHVVSPSELWKREAVSHRACRELWGTGAELAAFCKIMVGMWQ